jgi:hypothetical protein
MRPALIEIPSVKDELGNLSFLEDLPGLPFTVVRSYWIWNLPRDAARGAHAHRVTDELFVAVSGHFEVTADDGCERSTFRLDDPSVGLLVPRLNWISVGSFSAGAVLLAFASTRYDDADYIRDYDQFRRDARSRPVSDSV